MPFPDYLRAAVLEPLALDATLDGDAAGGIVGTLGDMLAFGRGALAPTLIAPETLAEATTVQFPGLDGVLPGFGRQTPNDWGLGFELRDGKSPHWTGSRNSARTYGHFGSKPGRPRSSGSIRNGGSSPRQSPTAPSASGPPPRGPPSRTRYWRKSSSSRLSASGRSRLGRWPAPSIVSSRASGSSRASCSASEMSSGGRRRRRRAAPARPARRSGSPPTAPARPLAPRPRGQLLVVRTHSHRLCQRAHVGRRVRGEPHPGLLLGGSGEVSPLEERFLLCEAGLRVRRPRGGAQPGCDEHEPADEVGPRSGDLQGDAPAERAADDRCRPVEQVDGEGDVVDGRRFERGVAEPGQVGSEDAVAGCLEGIDLRRPHPAVGDTGVEEQDVTHRRRAAAAARRRPPGRSWRRPPA